MKQIHIKLSEPLHRQLRIQAAIKGQTLQDYVVEAIRDKIFVDQSNADVGLASTEGKSDGDKTT